MPAPTLSQSCSSPTHCSSHARRVVRRFRKIPVQSSQSFRLVDRQFFSKTNALCIGESLCHLVAMLAVVSMVLTALVSPAIALIEYDEQNEATPKVTPAGISKFATFYGAGISIALLSSILAPQLRRRRHEQLFQTPGHPHARTSYACPATPAPRGLPSWQRAWVSVA